MVILACCFGFEEKRDFAYEPITLKTLLPSKMAKSDSKITIYPLIKMFGSKSSYVKFLSPIYRLEHPDTWILEFVEAKFGILNIVESLYITMLCTSCRRWVLFVSSLGIVKEEIKSRPRMVYSSDIIIIARVYILALPHYFIWQ